MSLNPRVTDWRGRRVWVVGASTGIGAALVRALLERGACVAVTARNAARLAELGGLAPERVRVLAFDVNDADAWEAACATLSHEWKGIDHFIYCAAAYRPVRAWELSPALVREMVDTNLAAAMIGVSRVLPALLARGDGAISLVGSVAGYTGLPKSLVYGPTKAGLINFAEALYLDVHPRGLAVHVINPGFVDTPLTQQNDFTMPALLTPDQAAAEMVRGFEAGAFEIHFPKRFTCWLRLLRRLPYRLRFALLAKVAEQA
ncbi:MAG: SDR family NAD(P)-dependent oxidoreductase [Pseudomonadota bacterium]